MSIKYKIILSVPVMVYVKCIVTIVGEVQETLSSHKVLQNYQEAVQ
ncbi:unnamed protein product [Acanthoscelides obtectus]|uniref:Uncharacterized protein n=1 Tax=Acanthoscelides obtectus TaxID=200917 RepID=A0A9P0KVQ7_ACAOB|nr:unnamed protein product [Acanthoscelides obtectus]CAK1633711.1 hypothetical protein AOBTE_LOCUS8336 [Acanthoscelides obtectus]